MKSRAAAILIVSVLTLVLAGGCGTGGSPAGAVDKVIEAYRTNNPVLVRQYFKSPGLYDVFASYVPKGASLSIGSESTHGGSADVLVLFTPQTEISGYKLVLQKTGGSWKVVNFLSP